MSGPCPSAGSYWAAGMGPEVLGQMAQKDEKPSFHADILFHLEVLLVLSSEVSRECSSQCLTSRFCFWLDRAYPCRHFAKDACLVR